MINVVIVTHGEVGAKILEAAEVIVGKQQNVTVLSLGVKEGLDSFEKRLGELMAQIHTEDGVLVLADMWGGTPCNASLRQCQNTQWRYDLVTGLNLPMLISALSNRPFMPLEKLAQKLVDDGPRAVQRPLLKLKSAMKENG